MTQGRSGTTGPRGEVQGRSLVFHRDYPDPVGAVWAAVTESDGLARWIGSYAGRGGTGGTVEFTVTGEVDAGGEVAPPVTVAVRECTPPHRLVVDIPENGSDRAWHVEVTLHEEDGRTVLRFAQDLVDGIDAADVEAGWRWYLDRLRAALRDGPMPAWEDYAPAG